MELRKMVQMNIMCRAGKEFRNYSPDIQTWGKYRTG